MDTLLTLLGHLAGTIWRGRAFLLVFVLLCSIVAAAFSLTMPPVFRSSTLLIPNQSSGGLPGALGDLSGFVGQFGISAGAEDPSRIFPDILRSKALTHAILLSEVVQSDSSRAVYLDRLDVSGEGRGERLERATKLFQKELASVILNPKNSALKIVVYDRDPLVAATIANRMAAELDRINQEISRSNARQKRVFIEGRRTEVGVELAQREEDLRSFRETNRGYADSPQLMLEFERLSRRVRLGEEMYLTLTRELELAKIDEINDVPVINVLDRALPATERHAPRRGLIVITTAVLSIAVGILVRLGWEGRVAFHSAFDRAGRPTTGS